MVEKKSNNSDKNMEMDLNNEMHNYGIGNSLKHKNLTSTEKELENIMNTENTTNHPEVIDSRKNYNGYSTSFYCPVCAIFYDDVLDLKYHVFKYHIADLDIFVCFDNTCHKSFCIFSEYREHITKCHSDRIDIFHSIIYQNKPYYILKEHLILLHFYRTSNIDISYLDSIFCYGCFHYVQNRDMHSCANNFFYLKNCPCCGKHISFGKTVTHFLYECNAGLFNLISGKGNKNYLI
ncbi:hypothetical protein SLOPH_493 [Spraguea lophii 42_110]|uniref:C2H2-type domain-containing protein n=1 Tax=Spraguea lophii (strain 42_110) TaxID=1358809 RepID=S7XGT8_SPRLO|nr:hypothetical protein SLOPH_493 [Spraguea lophii 42_110]